MGKTIAELIAEGKSVEEISKMAQAEADAVAAAKRKIDPKEVEDARKYLIADMLDYMEAVTGIELSEKEANEITKDMTDKMKTIELFIKAMDIVDSESKPTVKKKPESDPMAELFNLFRPFSF